MSFVINTLLLLLLTVVVILVYRRRKSSKTSLSIHTESETPESTSADAGSILTVSLLKVDQAYFFDINNVGNQSAYQISFKLIDCEHSPLSATELSERFPISRLKPNKPVTLTADIDLTSPFEYQVELNWLSKKKEAHSQIFHLTLPSPFSDEPSSSRISSDQDRQTHRLDG